MKKLAKPKPGRLSLILCCGYVGLLLAHLSQLAVGVTALHSVLSMLLGAACAMMWKGHLGHMKTMTALNAMHEELEEASADLRRVAPHMFEDSPKPPIH